MFSPMIWYNFYLIVIVFRLKFYQLFIFSLYVVMWVYVFHIYIYAHIYVGFFSFSADSFLGWVFLFSYAFLHHFAWKCWMKSLLSFLFFTIMIVSCSPIYFCQVFLHAINLSFIYWFCFFCCFHCRAELRMAFYLLDFHSWCIYKALEYAVLNPIYVFQI